MVDLGEAVADFDGNDWQRVGMLTGCFDIIRRHDRLLRAIRFGDPDVPQAAMEVLVKIVESDPDNMPIIEKMVAEKRGEQGENISTAPSKTRPIVFTPSVFEVPDEGVD